MLGKNRHILPQYSHPLNRQKKKKKKTYVCVCTPGTWDPEQTGLGAWMISLNRITRAHGVLMRSGLSIADLALAARTHLAALNQLLLGCRVLVGHGCILGGSDGLRGRSCSLLSCNLQRTGRGGEQGLHVST